MAQKNDNAGMENAFYNGWKSVLSNRGKSILLGYGAEEKLRYYPDKPKYYLNFHSDMSSMNI